MAADFTAWLEASPMLNDVEHFRSYPSADTTHRRDRSALDTFRNRGRKVSDDVQRFRDEVLAWLDARPRTAGVILVDAAMRNEPLADTLTKLLPHQDAIAALDADGQNQIVAALRPLSELPTDVTGDAADLAKMLNGGRGNALADRAQDILDIKALQPHSNQAYELGQTVGGLAVGLYSAGDTEKSLDLLAHWQQLLEKHAANQGGHYSDRLTNDLQQMMWNRGDHPDLSPVLLVNAMATDARLAPITDNRLLSALEYPFDNVIDNLPPAPGATTDNSGRWFAGLDQLATRLDGGPAAALLPALTEEAKDRHKDDEYDASLALLAQRTSAAPDAPIFTTAQAALRMARMLDRSKDDPLDPTDQAFVADHLSALATDATVPASTRLAILTQALRQLNWRAPDSTAAAAAAAATLLVNVLKTHPEWVNNESADAILYGAHTSDRTEGWPADAELVDAYLTALTRRPRRGHTPTLSVQLPSTYRVAYGSTSLREPRAALSLLQIALDAGLNDQADRLLSHENATLATCPAAWHALATHGRSVTAADAIRRHATAARPMLLRSFTHSPEAAAALPDVLAHLHDKPDLAFFSECAFAALADPDENLKKQPDSAPTPRTQRLTALAQRYDAAVFPNPALRDATLLMLASDDRAAAVIAEPLAQATKKLKLSSLGNQNNSLSVPKQLLLA